MDGAELHIRFNPLIQRVADDNNNCCLEIVPEISHLENLDSLQWEDQSYQLECMIPITYKIILKKLDICSTMKEDRPKFYHSCVDLFCTPSTNNVNNETKKSTHYLNSCAMMGDVLKNINKVVIQNETDNEELKINRINRITSEMTLTQKISKGTQVSVMKSKSLKRNVRNLKIQVDDNEISAQSRPDKMGSKSDVCLLKRDLNVKNVLIQQSQIQPTHVLIFQNNDATKLPSDVAAIKQANVMHPNLMISSRNSQHQNYHIDSIRIDKKFLHHESKCTQIECNMFDAGESLTLPSICRPSVDTRVATILQKVRTEIMPLNHMLNEMIKKCVSLSFYLKQETRGSEKSMNNCHTLKAKNKNCLTLRTISPMHMLTGMHVDTPLQPSNRVVYNIVYSEC